MIYFLTSCRCKAPRKAPNPRSGKLHESSWYARPAMELLTHFLSGARKLGTRWYTKWLGMAFSLGKRMEKRWEKDGKSVGEWQTIFFAWLYEGTTERDWMTSNSRTAFVLPFISRRCTLHTLANFAFTPFCSLLLFRSCFSRLYPVFVLPTVLVACSSFFSSFSSFFLPLADESYGQRKIGIAEARNRPRNGRGILNDKY